LEKQVVEEQAQIVDVARVFVRAVEDHPCAVTREAYTSWSMLAQTSPPIAGSA